MTASFSGATDEARYSSNRSATAAASLRRAVLGCQSARMWIGIEGDVVHLPQTSPPKAARKRKLDLTPTARASVLYPQARSTAARASRIEKCLAAAHRQDCFAIRSRAPGACCVAIPAADRYSRAPCTLYAARPERLAHRLRIASKHHVATRTDARCIAGIGVYRVG